MGILELLKGGQRGKGGPEPPTQIETRTYDELMDELVQWNIDHTDILNVLRKEVESKRLESWSDALEKGIRKNLSPPSGKKEDNPLFPVFLDLYRFVKNLRVRLLANPTMKNVRPMERSDSISVCIICGIRALQKEMGARRLIDSLQWMMLERYLG